MRSLVESTARWQETLKYSSSLQDLQDAVKRNGPNSPCISGCRSVCWKAFLLSQSSSVTNWSHALLESRSTYSSLRDHFLKYIKHPEYLNAGNSDPLTDDADSPWNNLRLDEMLRSEILQDVQRLPDEPFYHQPHIQILILDVLFIYCKLNPDVGGYRQGMHELLAPIVFVVEQDAIDPIDTASDASVDLRMVEMLDASFVEHDAFALFSKVMDCAKSFYETDESNPNSANTTFGHHPQTSSIVEKSQHIHEVCLQRVDPQLSHHLKDIEILPQVFLIRWIRLLFSREFPFDQMLILWDTLFSVDPSFKLIDLICTAMLIRIRWDLLKADYTLVLQSLLRYSPPEAPHGPHTFVDDAVFLRDHLDADGGSELILKYTGKAPDPAGTSLIPVTPRASGLGAQRETAGTRLPLSPSRFRPPVGGVEALFQGAAKGVLERGEKLGINQAVRDAMLEIRRNVQEAARTSMKPGRDLFTEPGPNTAMRAVAEMDRRNSRLASMLDESVASLKTLAAPENLVDKGKARDTLEIAAAKIQFVKIYLEDSTLALQDEEPTANIVEENSTPLTDAVAAMALNTAMILDSPNPEDGFTPKAPSSPILTGVQSENPTIPSGIDTPTRTDPLRIGESIAASGPVPSTSSSAASSTTLRRPDPPIPTRSTLAQSSFSWMLEPDTTVSSSARPHQSSSSSVFSTSSTPLPSSSNPFKNPSEASKAHRKRPSANANRERTAFLFGEVPFSDAQGNAIRSEDIFGLEPISRKGGKG